MTIEKKTQITFVRKRWNAVKIDISITFSINKLDQNKNVLNTGLFLSIKLNVDVEFDASRHK